MERRIPTILSSSSHLVRHSNEVLLCIFLTEDADRADELHGKHTVFGRVVGDTIYSEYALQSTIKRHSYFADVAKIGEMGEYDRGFASIGLN